jgi:hypothetical protein
MAPTKRVSGAKSTTAADPPAAYTRLRTPTMGANTGGEHRLHSEPPPPPRHEVPVPDAPQGAHADAAGGAQQGGTTDAAVRGQPDKNDPLPPPPHRDASHMPTTQSHPQGGGGGQRAASASRRSALAPSGIRSRGEALAAVNAMFVFLPVQDMPVYEDWRARINVLLEYARQRPEPARLCSQSHHGPIAGPANNTVQPAPALAPQQPTQPIAKAPENASVGSSASHPPRDAWEIINERQAKDARVHVERNHHWRREAWNSNAREVG